MRRTEGRGRAWVEVDLDALLGNARRVLEAVGPSTRLLPMVKADAYGVGMPRVAAVLAAGLPADDLAGFGVATIAEGEALRRGGWTGDILVFSPAWPAEFARAAAADLVLCLSDLDAVAAWRAQADRVGRVLRMHVEIDTGMGRAGLPWDRAAEWGRAVAGLATGALRWEGCYTHFHSADEPDLAPTQRQWERLQAALAALPPVAPGEPPRLVHAANSAAALRCRFPCDLARPGIFLYGGRVGAEPPAPVVSVRARVVLVREVAPGTTVGYGATYAARRAERWGTLGIGYGDGLPRALGTGVGSALICGRRVPILGRISMDMSVVDLTDVPEAAVGTVATLIGRDGDAEITVDEVAAQAGTISYEILTGLTPRLPRLYRGGAGAAPDPGAAQPAASE